MATHIQLRRDTAANWTAANTLLMQGEFGYELDTGKFKIGDGATAWVSLGYAAQTGTNFTGNLGGDVIGTQSATVVSQVGGSTAANVHAAEQLANAATAANTANAILKRDGSGQVAATTFTGNLTGNVTGNLTGTAATATAPATGSAHGAVSLDSSGTFKSVAPGTSGNVLQSNGTDWVSATPGAGS